MSSPDPALAHISSGLRIFSWLVGGQKAEFIPLFIARNDRFSMGIGQSGLKSGHDSGRCGIAV
jgi:hypothetical protein